MDNNASNIPPQAPPQPVAPPQAYDPGVVEEGNDGKKKIISFVIGLGVILVLLIIFFVFLRPIIFPSKDKEVTLTYWLVFDDPEPFRQAAAEFTQAHPNIKVKVEKQDIKALGKYVQLLDTRINNGNGPDVFRYHNSWLPEVKPLLLPLPQDVVNTTQISSKYYPTVGVDVKAGGAYFGVPIMFDTLSLYVNTDLFTQAGIGYPSTWDDMVSAARQLTVKDANGKITTSGAAIGTYDNIAHASDIVSVLLLQNGANLIDLAGSSKQSSVDALDFYTSFARGDSNVWDNSMENSTIAFEKGQLAMYFGYSWDAFEIKASNPNLNFKVIPVPHLPSQNKTTASYWVEGVSSKTKHPKEAFEFLQYLASKQTMEKLYASESKIRLYGELYPRPDMADSLKSNTLAYSFLVQGKDAISTIFSSDTYDGAMIDSLNSYLGNAINSILKNSSSPETAVDTLAEGVAQVLSKYVQAAGK